MPDKKVYGMSDFETLKGMLQPYGFEVIERKESRDVVKRLGLVRGRVRDNDPEFGLKRTVNFMTVYVWTSFSRITHETQDDDMGWVLITQGDRAHYFAHPFRRTEGFILRIARMAWVACHKAANRPMCPECDKLMNIHQNRDTGATFWYCQNPDVHQKPVYKSWDCSLKKGGTAQAFVDSLRKPRASYRKRNKKAGYQPTPARKIRIRWNVTRPQNQVRITT